MNIYEGSITGNAVSGGAESPYELLLEMFVSLEHGEAKVELGDGQLVIRRSDYWVRVGRDGTVVIGALSG